MKKTFILTVSFLLVCSSAFAWSKKTEGQANLGRTYVEVGGYASFPKYKTSATDTNTPTNGGGCVAFNIPFLKPNVNALKDVSWFGVDGKASFNIGGGEVGTFGTQEIDMLSYDVDVAIIPYLSFKTGWSFLQAVKPFAYAKVGYKWYEMSSQSVDIDQNYFTFGAGAGVEVALTSCLSATGTWNWESNNERGIPNTTSIDVELTYWINGMVGIALFGEYSFGGTYEDLGVGLDVENATMFGIKVRIGFNR